jgi:molybdate transport system regulatory protein
MARLARFWIKLEPDLSIGPGKADLLEGVRRTGSIAGAGRAMRMSYKRAWTLIEEMNRRFKGPLVAAAKGGEKGGGARLTATGAAVLRHYRRMERRAAKAASADAAAIRRLMTKR